MVAKMELEDAIGAQWREAQEHKADRAATLLYTATPRRPGVRGPNWSVAQRWILDVRSPSRPWKYFIRETVRESVETADGPPSARPALIRVAGLAYVRIPGPVVVERSRSIGPEVLAVLAGYLEMRGREMVTWLPGGRHQPFSVTKSHRREWIKDAGLSPATSTAGCRI